jgi:hypothetical protein
VAQVFTASGVLKNIEEQVRFARARFGTYDLVDFVAVLIGYAVSAEPSLQAFYERLQPFASAFMALFGRKNLPHRSTPLVAIWPLWISQPWKHCVRCFSMIWSCEPLRPFRQADCGIVWALIGWWSMWTALNKPHDNEHFLHFPLFPLPIDVLIGCVLLAILGANEERSLERERPYSRRTHITGWARSVALEMGIIVGS